MTFDPEILAYQGFPEASFIAFSSVPLFTDPELDEGIGRSLGYVQAAVQGI